MALMMRTMIKSGILSILFIVFSCGNTRQEQKAMQEIKNEGFDQFYSKFHSDSVFQMSRIVFPLEGINTEDMSILDTIYYWTEDKWVFLREPDSNIFQIEYEKTDTTVIEEVTSEGHLGLVFKSYFEIKKGKWYLARLEDVNL